MYSSMAFDTKTWNGHTHTEFCPHGSKEDTELFIKKAIKSGFKTYSITEHFPMAPEFYQRATGSSHAIETAAMSYETLPEYFEKMNYLKSKYSNFIKILVGFEVDYIEEFKDWTSQALADNIQNIDDAIMSVHFLPTTGGLRAVDDSYEDFCNGVMSEYKTPVKVANVYLATMLQAINWLDVNEPRRYGHITLYRKWIQNFPKDTVWQDQETAELVERILDTVARKGEMLDCNMSGINRNSQQEPSPTWDIIRQAQAKNVKLVYGSDTHQVADVDQGYIEFLNIGEN